MGDNTIYKRYLKTKHWQTVRQEILKRANGHCERCGCECDRLQVHHKTYTNLYYEKYDDLIAVCPRCHMQLHGKYNGKGARPSETYNQQ